MKYKLNIATTITLIILILTFTNCEKEKRYHRKIDGIWVEINDDIFKVGPSWHFDKNNDFHTLHDICDQNSIYGSGIYNIEEDSLFMRYTYSYKPSTYPYDTTIIVTIIDTFIIKGYGWTPNRGKILKIETTKGETRKFEKCPKGMF